MSQEPTPGLGTDLLRSSENQGQIAKALAQAQSTMKGAVKGSKNPFFGSSYADLSAVWEACRDALGVQGLSIVQSPSTEFMGKPEIYMVKDRPMVKVATVVRVTTRMSHSSGEWIEGCVSAMLATGDAQSVGSAITYLRRYALASFAGVAPEDDDGEGAMGRKGSGRDDKKPEERRPDRPVETRSQGETPSQKTTRLMREVKAELDTWDADSAQAFKERILGSNATLDLPALEKLSAALVAKKREAEPAAESKVEEKVDGGVDSRWRGLPATVSEHGEKAIKWEPCRGCGAPVYWGKSSTGKPCTKDADGKPHLATCSNPNKARAPKPAAAAA